MSFLIIFFFFQGKFWGFLDKGPSKLRTCQELPGVILCLFCCVGWFCARARLDTVTPGRNKTNKRIVRGYSWHVLSVDWPQSGNTGPNRRAEDQPGVRYF